MENYSTTKAIKILLVDDNPGDADLICRLLSEQGAGDFHVERADRLSLALEHLGKANFDVVLLDLGLPDSNGLSTLSQARKANPTVPIVVLTGDNDTATSMAALREGAQDYLVKGKIEAETLTRVLHYAIERQRLRGGIRKSEQFLRTSLDSLSANIAIISEAEEILFVNKAWRDFANANDANDDNAYVGTNYLQVCDTAKGDDAAMAQAFAAGIRSVICGATDFFEMEYPCNSPSQERWFCGRVTAFPGKGPRNVTVAHENITARRQAEQALQQKYDELERFNKLTVDRELCMIELKKEVNALLKEAGQPPRYKENQ